MTPGPRYRVLAVDLDGTLISNVHDPEHPVSAANLEALRELRAAGTRIVISTGRSEGAARSVLGRCGDPQLAASDLILHNGALMVDGATGATCASTGSHRQRGATGHLASVVEVGVHFWVSSPVILEEASV